MWPRILKKVKLVVLFNIKSVQKIKRVQKIAVEKAD
jgi:hypothetical protein